ncbi:MAG TPA: hypothetical protein VFG65_07645 [Fimbriimonadales bacterium]|nr:hypothetical protein [Fimbriimonadales bacterium]
MPGTQNPSSEAQRLFPEAVAVGGVGTAVPSGETGALRPPLALLCQPLALLCQPLALLFLRLSPKVLARALNPAPIPQSGIGSGGKLFGVRRCL